MAYKNIEDSRAAIRRHYYANREKYLLKNKLRRQAMRRALNELKASSPCADCAKKYPYYVMDFDHLEDKQYLISGLIKANNKTALDREIAKCEKSAPIVTEFALSIGCK